MSRDPEPDATSDAGVGGADPAALVDEVVLLRLLAGGVTDMAVEDRLAGAAAGRNLEPSAAREIIC